MIYFVLCLLQCFYEKICANECIDLTKYTNKDQNSMKFSECQTVLNLLLPNFIFIGFQIIIFYTAIKYSN